MSPSMKHAQVRDVVAQRRDALGAHAEREAGVRSGSMPDVAEHVRVDHPAAEDLQPARCPCRTGSRGRAQMPQLTSTSAEGSVKGKKCGRIARAPVGAEHLAHEVLERALQVAERDALVDDESLDLVELRQMARVGDVAPVDPAGHDDVDGRLLRLHHADLHR